MPEKKYLIEIPGKEGVSRFNEKDWTENKDSILAKYPNANVTSIDMYDADDVQDTDAYLVSIKGKDGLSQFTGAEWKQHRDAILGKYPDAKVSRARSVDYFYEQAKDIEGNMDEQDSKIADWEQRRKDFLANLSYDDSAKIDQLDIQRQSGLQGMAFNENDPILAQYNTLMAEGDELKAEQNRLRGEYEANPRVQAAMEEWQKEYNQYKAESINRTRNEIARAIETEVDEEAAAKAKIAKMQSISMTGAMSAQTDLASIGELQKLERLNSANYFLDLAQEAKDGNLKGFWKGMKDVGSAFLEGVKNRGDIANYADLFGIMKKLEKKVGSLKNISDEDIDSNLSESEKLLLKSYFEYADALEKADVDFKYRAGQIGGEGIKFAIEFALTAGASGAVSSAATMGLTNAIERWALRAIGSGAKKWVVKAAEKGAIAATRGAMNVVLQTALRPSTYAQMAQSTIEIDEYGHLNGAKNSAISFVDSTIETLSEMSGDAIGKLLGFIPMKGIKGFAGKAFGNTLGKTKFGRFGRALLKGTFGDYLKAAGFHGAPVEMLEEVVGSALREMTINDQAFEESFGGDNKYAMALGFLPMTFMGGAFSVAGLGASQIAAKNASSALASTLANYGFTEGRIKALTNYTMESSPIELALQAKEMIAELKRKGASEEDIEVVNNYMSSTAGYQAMRGAKKEQEVEERASVLADTESQYGKFYREGENGKQVTEAVLNDGRSIFVLSDKTAEGEYSAIDQTTGKEIFIKESDIKSIETPNGQSMPMMSTLSADEYASNVISQRAQLAEAERMLNERNAQIAELSRLLPKKINLGTEGDENMVAVKGQDQKGVTVVDAEGNETVLSWEEVGMKMGAPIKVLTDAQLAEAEAAEIGLSRAERRAKGAKTEGQAKAVESEVNAINQGIKDVTPAPEEAYTNPESGLVDEDAFWEGDPEGFCDWNDRQNQDGGQDSREQIESSLVKLQAKIQETAKLATDSPNARKAVKAEVQRLQEKIDRLVALQQKYNEKAVTEEQKAQERAELVLLMRERVNQWRELLGLTEGDLTVYESIDEVENPSALAQILKAKTEGWYDTESKKAFLFFPDIASLEELDSKIMHEVVTHFGLDKVMGEEAKNQLLDTVWSMMSDAARRSYLNYPGVDALDGQARQRAAANEFMAKVAESVKVGTASAEQKSIWQRIADFFNNLFKKVNAFFNGKDVADFVLENYRLLTEGKRTELAPVAEAAATQTEAAQPEMSQAEADRQVEAILNQSGISLMEDLQENVMAQAETMTDNNGDAIPSKTNNGTNLYSTATAKPWVDNLGHEHRGTMEVVLERMAQQGFSEKEIKQMEVKMQTAYDYMMKLQDLTNPDGSVRFEEFNAWAEKTPYYKQIGRNFVKAITSLVSNGDYPINLELTTDCIKREAFTMLLNELVKRGADLAGMGPAEIVTIQKMMKQYGIQVACALCFVEGKRLQIVNWASQIVDDWNDALLEAGIETDEMFEFGKDGDAFIPADEWRTYENKPKLAKTLRTLDEIAKVFQGLDPETFKEQVKKNKRDLAEYEKQKSEVWAAKNNKPASAWKPTKEQEREMKKIKVAGLAPVFVNENMKAFHETYELMRNEWMEKNPGKDPLSFTPSSKQWQQLETLRNNQIKDVKQKMVRLIMEYPEMRKKMTLNDLLGSKGLMEIRQQHGVAYEQLYSIILQRFGTGTPKPVQDAVPYDGEVMTLTESAFKAANKIGGARLFSFSDFDITKVFDYMQMFFDLEANKQMLQSYTKEVAAVLLFGRSNAKFNISTLASAVVPAEVMEEYNSASEAKKKDLRHQWAENAGLLVDENGNITGISFSEEHSVSPEFAQQIFHDDSRNKDCGAIMVGASVNHAIYSAAQAWIRMVIPFHLSGMPIAARDKTDVKWWTDNTEYQSTRKKTKDGWSKIDKKDDTFEFYADMHQEGWNMRDKAREYLDWCKSNAFRPKFDWGINSDYYRVYCEENGYTPNQQIIDMMDADTTNGVWNQYYKFLTDFTAYKPVFNEEGEMIDEIPSPQQRVVTNFDLSEMEKQVIFEGENSMLARREGNIALANQHVSELADRVTPFLNGEITEEEMGLRDDVFYDARKDAEAYLEAKGNLLYSTIAEREVENVIVDSSKTNLPTNREEAIKAVAALKKPFINKDQQKEIIVSKNAIRHTATQDSYHKYVDVKILGVIDSIIANAVKIGNEPVAEDEKGHTHLVEIYYCPVNLDGKQYSVRMVVKQYENRGNVIEEFRMYDAASKQKKSSASSQGTGNESLTPLLTPDSVYKVKDLIHNSQEEDKKLVGIEGNTLFSTSSNPAAEESAIMFSTVTDPFKVAELESGKKIPAYRSVQIDDEGRIYSPMASRIQSRGRRNEAAQMREWDQAVENLDLVTRGEEYGKITILDEDGGQTKVSYNPYGHCCVNSMMNDQFKRAWERDGLYVMKVEAPESELTSGYKAEQAKDAVGIHMWKTGAVGRKLPESKRRQILLTRWMKNVQVMTWEEVAQDWINTLKGEKIDVPFNVVPRKILNLLTDAGVKIVAPEKGMENALNAYNEWKSNPIGYVGDTALPAHVAALNETKKPSGPDGGMRFSTETTNFASMDSNGKQLTPSQQEFFANSKAVDKDGNLLVLYHGTPRAGFTEFKGGWFTTSKEDAVSYSGDRKGRLFDPNEEYVPETLTAGDYRLGYMTFDSEEDRADFLKRFPTADTAMSERDYEVARLGADEEYDELTARRKGLKKIWDAYWEYERERFVDSTIGDILDNPESYTEEDMQRAMLAYDSNASMDSLDETVNADERKDMLIAALAEANEETEGGIRDIKVETRVPRNGEGVKHNDSNRRTYEVYANIQSPYEVDANGRGSEFVSGDVYKAVEEALADEQYDGVIIRNWRVGRYQQLGDVVVPKNGNQIKLTSNENPTKSENIRFSTRQPNQTAVEFHQAVVNDFKSKYNDIADIQVFPINEETAKRFDFTVDELEEVGGTYVPEDDLIAIFAREAATTSFDVEESIFHELVHKLSDFFEYLKDTGKWMWEAADKYKVFALYKDHIMEKYEEKAYYEEMLSFMLGFTMACGGASKLYNGVPEDIQKHIDDIFNEIGYDRERESNERLLRLDDESSVEEAEGSKREENGGRGESETEEILFSTEQRAVETGALRGLATLGAFMPFAEVQRVIDESIAEREKKLSSLTSKGAKNEVEEERIRKAERDLSVAKRQRELWDEINGRLVDVTPVKPATDFSAYDLEAQSPEEFIAQMLTMQTTRVNKEGYDEKGNKIIYKVNKKTGIMLSPETLQKELGWSKEDWSKLRYIVSSKEGISIDALAEMISEDKEAQSIFGNMDVMEIKDRILNFLQAVSSYTEIRDYIKNARTRQAEEEADFANARMREIASEIEEASGMTIDEYNNEIIRESLDEIEAELERLDSSEIYGKFEDLTEDDYERSLSDVSRREDAGISEGDEAVSEYGDVADVSSEETETGASDRDSGRDDSGDVGDREGEAGRDGAPALGDKKSKVVSASIDTSDLSVEEIVKEGKQKVVSANAEAVDVFMDRIRRINGNLQQLRMAAAAQREYDQKTVKTITDIANSLLEGGALNDLTRGEVKRLLGIINGGVGKADLTISVNRLMNLMVENQLRYGKGLIEKFLKIRGSKVNQSGVETRGTLDIPGQQMLDAFKEGIGLSAESLANKIAEAEDALFSEYETERRNSENKLVGFYLAKQYQDEISASEEEEKVLKDEIRKANEDYKVGKLTKKEQKELVKSIHDAILENKIQRVNAYEKLASNLGAKIAGSIQNAGLLRDAEKERVQRIQHYANSDLQGKSASAHEVAKSKFWNNGLVRIITSPLVTFEQWLRVFGEKSAEGKGYLWNYFMNKWNEANNNEYKGMVEAHKVLDGMVRTIFGGKYTRWSDLFSIEKKMPTMKVEMYDEGEQKEYEFSQGNLLYIYMVNKMTDGKMKLAKMGITQDEVDAIVAQMDPRFIQLADWMQEKFLPSLRDKYNAVHERLFGAPMASIDNYFPLKVNQNARVREVDVTAGEGAVKPSTITGSIIKRTKNSLALDVRNADAFDVMLEHIQQMEHWAAFAEFNKDLNTLLSYKKFRNRVQNMSGVFGSGEEAWKNFKESAEIAAGVYKPKTSKADKAMTNIVKGLTTGKINFRLWTAMKQILSMPAFAPYTNLATFGKNLAAPMSAFDWAMENLPAFEKRWKSREAGNVRLKKTEADWKTWDWMETASRIGMTPNAFVDAVTCAIGAKSVYETKYNQYVKDGYTAGQADEKAKLDATVVFNATQQSSEAAFLSAIQIDRTFISHLLTVFRNNSFGMQREMVDAVRNMRHRMSEGYKEQSIEFMKKQMIRDGLSEDNAERAAQRIYRNGVFKDAARIATFGYLMQFLWALGNSALYMLFGDDDEEKREMLKEAAIRGSFGSIEGLGGGNVIADGLTALATGQIDKFSASFSPAISDIESLMDEMKRDVVAGASELVNILGQALVGVNPQIVADTAYAIYDACNGDLETSTEAGLLLLRMLQAPQSNIDKLFVDEIDFATDKGLDLTIEEFAKRYADYKYKRNAPYTFLFYSDENERKQEDKYIKRFLRDAEDLKRSRGNEEAKKYYEYLDTDYKETTDTINELRRKAKESAMKGDQVGAMEYAKMLDDFMKTDLFKDYVKFGGKAKAIESIRDKMKKVDLQTRESLEDMMLELRREMVEEMEKAND